MPQGHQYLGIAMLAVMFIALLLSGCTKRIPVEPGAPKREVAVEHDPLVLVRLFRRLEPLELVPWPSALPPDPTLLP